MKTPTTLWALVIAIDFVLVRPATADHSEEIIVKIPQSETIVKLPEGRRYVPLSPKDVEHAKLAARQAYQQAKAGGLKRPVIVQLPGEVLQLSQPIVLGPEDSGDADRPIVWRGATSEPHTLVSAGVFLSEWTELEPGVVQTRLPEVAAGVWHFRTIWNLQQAEQPIRCRVPKKGFFRIEKSGRDRRTHFFWQSDDLKPYDDLANVELVFIHDWSITRCPIQSLDAKTRMLRVPHQIGNGLQFFNIDHWEAQPRYFLENSIEFLTEPGEWHLDRATGTLTYRLREGETAESLVLIAPKLENILTFAGTADHPVRHVHVEKISFSHTNSKPENEDTYWGVQATWHHQPKPGDSGTVSVAPLSGAVNVTHAEDCLLENITIEEVAATGLSFGRGSVACTLQNSLIANCGGNGIMVGMSDQNAAAVGNTIDHCRIRRAGRLFYGAVGIWIGFSQETTVSNSTIFDVPYTGISCGWQWNPKPTVSRAQRIINNEIGHCMQVLSDGGGIYTLGFQPDSILSGNLIHDIPLNAGRAESNGMFLDEGTKGFTIENNFIYGTDKSPLRFHRADTNIVRSNYLIIPKADVPMIRYNNTPEANITKVENVTKVDDLQSAIHDWQTSIGLQRK
jgi:hypothetical protein